MAWNNSAHEKINGISYRSINANLKIFRFRSVVYSPRFLSSFSHQTPTFQILWLALMIVGSHTVSVGTRWGYASTIPLWRPTKRLLQAMQCMQGRAWLQCSGAGDASARDREGGARASDGNLTVKASGSGWLSWLGLFCSSYLRGWCEKLLVQTIWF